MKRLFSALVWLPIIAVGAWMASADGTTSDHPGREVYAPAKHDSPHPEDCWACSTAELTRNPFGEDTARKLDAIKEKAVAKRRANLRTEAAPVHHEVAKSPPKPRF
jgi:hypothetical protein